VFVCLPTAQPCCPLSQALVRDSAAFIALRFAVGASLASFVSSNYWVGCVARAQVHEGWADELRSGCGRAAEAASVRLGRGRRTKAHEARRVRVGPRGGREVASRMWVPGRAAHTLWSVSCRATHTRTPGGAPLRRLRGGSRLRHRHVVGQRRPGPPAAHHARAVKDWIHCSLVHLYCSRCSACSHHSPYEARSCRAGYLAVWRAREVRALVTPLARCQRPLRTTAHPHTPHITHLTLSRPPPRYKAMTHVYGPNESIRAMSAAYYFPAVCVVWERGL
jgi:hypothetical protein